jgi:hypothetical protein
VTFTSGADGSVLVADAATNVLTTVASESPAATSASARLQVVDLGLGRVALKTNTGAFVSVDGEAAVLKTLGSVRPGTAESFQWVNLMRGDTMLMSLTNHRYLATTPAAPGPVRVTSPGPTGARKSGAELRWR